jgi:antitoxin VapB
MYIPTNISEYSPLHIHEEQVLSLYIRDDDVDALAKKVQQVTKAPTKTEAVRRALENELARAEQAVPLKERVRKIQDSVRAKMGPNKPDFDMKKFTDDMWEI